MKKIYKLSLLVLLMIIISLITLKVDAASATISGNMTVTQGETVTVTALVNAGAWNLRLEGAGRSEGLVGQTSVTSNSNASTSITFTASSVGTYIFTLKGDITDYDTDETTKINKSSVITVKEPEPTPTPTPTPTPKSTPTPTPTKTNNTTQKSSNNNLANLGIEPNDFTGFDSGKTTYNVTVPNEVTEVNVYATKQDAKANISGTGKKQLNEGVNSLEVICTAENGSTKKYTINVTREAPTQVTTQETTTDEVVTEEIQILEENKQLKLESMEIVGFELEPEFNSDTYIYNIEIENKNVQSLTILAKPNYENAKIIISGNENLRAGQNKITVEAILEDSDKSIKYTIFATKPEVPDYSEEVIRLQQEAQDKNLLIFTILIIAVISIGFNIYFIINKIKNRIKL